MVSLKRIATRKRYNACMDNIQLHIVIIYLTIYERNSLNMFYSTFTYLLSESKKGCAKQP